MKNVSIRYGILCLIGLGAISMIAKEADDPNELRRAIEDLDIKKVVELAPKVDLSTKLMIDTRKYEATPGSGIGGGYKPQSITLLEYATLIQTHNNRYFPKAQKTKKINAIVKELTTLEKKNIS